MFNTISKKNVYIVAHFKPFLNTVLYEVGCSYMKSEELSPATLLTILAIIMFR
jgi:hypothetical protein